MKQKLIESFEALAQFLVSRIFNVEWKTKLGRIWRNWGKESCWISCTWCWDIFGKYHWLIYFDFVLIQFLTSTPIYSIHCDTITIRNYSFTSLPNINQTYIYYLHLFSLSWALFTFLFMTIHCITYYLIDFVDLIIFSYVLTFILQD